jgi:hypothetical protein
MRRRGRRPAVEKFDADFTVWRLDDVGRDGWSVDWCE